MQKKFMPFREFVKHAMEKVQSHEVFRKHFKEGKATGNVGVLKFFRQAPPVDIEKIKPFIESLLPFEYEGKRLELSTHSVTGSGIRTRHSYTPGVFVEQQGNSTVYISLKK